MNVLPTVTVVDVLIKHGIGTCLTLVGCFLFYMLIKHILSQQTEIMKMATSQNQHWQGIISEHSSNAKLFHNEVKEAHKFQREEHKEIIQICGRINGYKT